MGGAGLGGGRGGGASDEAEGTTRESRSANVKINDWVMFE